MHIDAIRAYRLLATAVGPTTARDTMRGLAADPSDAAFARIGSLYVELALERERTLFALDAVGAIREEPRDDDADQDAMTITQLAEALEVLHSELEAHLEVVAQRTEHLLRAGTSLVELRSALTSR